MGHWLEINQWIFMGRKPWFYSLGISIPLSKFASSYISILYCEAIISRPRIICGPVQYYDLYSCQEQFQKFFKREGRGLVPWGCRICGVYTRTLLRLSTGVTNVQWHIFIAILFRKTITCNKNEVTAQCVFLYFCHNIRNLHFFFGSSKERRGALASHPILSPVSAPVCIIFWKHMVLFVPVLFNLENIYYSPSCSGGTNSLHHSFTSR